MSLKKANDTIYLNIVNGKFARSFKVANRHTESRINKNGQEVHEEYYKAVEGTITGLDTKVHDEYGEQLLIYMQSGDEKYCVQTNLNGRYGVNFLKTLPNADLSKPLELAPFEKTIEDGKKDQTIFIRQGNVTLKRFYTKERGDLPQPILRKGKRGQPDTWDYEPVTDFLFVNVLEPTRAALKSKQGDDLPF